VAEITSKDTYNGIKPKIGGLFDPRMGVLDPGMIMSYGWRKLYQLSWLFWSILF